jgi:hypothetical protein
MTSNQYAAQLTKIAENAKAVREAATAEIASLQANKDYSAEWKEAKLKEVRGKFRAASEKLAADRRDILARAAADVPTDTRPAADAMLEDSRVARRWSDIRDQLAKGASWQGVAELAVDTGDTTTLSALADELPRYAAGQAPMPLHGHRGRAQAAMVQVAAALDPIVAQHGAGHRQAAAQHRRDVATADALASVEVNAATSAVAGTFNQLGYAVEAHYAQAANGDAGATA